MVGKMVAVAVAAAAQYETGSFNFKCDDIVKNLKQVMVMWKIACVNVFCIVHGNIFFLTSK
jgi:hypothetical protein